MRKALDSRLIRLSDTHYSLAVRMDSRLPKPDQMTAAEAVVVQILGGFLVWLSVGFLTDCHSTPTWSQGLLPGYNNKTNLAAIVHDWLYINWEEFLLDYPGHQGGRAFADQAYLELMERFNPGAWRNRLYYAGVRLGGWYNWQRERKRARAGAPPINWPEPKTEFNLASRLRI